MKKILIVSLLMLSTSASADCYMRSSINLSNQRVMSGPADMQKLVTPDARGSKCVVRYRVNIDNDWQNAEGVSYGATESEACTKALDFKRGSLLSEVTPTRVQADNQMVCSDVPEIRVRVVHINDIIYESETDLHTMPQFRKPFQYKRSHCRMFVERDSKNQNLMLYQGVICRIDNMPNSKWRVVDKF